MIPFEYERIINNAWDKTKALCALVGQAPEVNGLCSLKDSCDQCRNARKTDSRYMDYIYASWAGQYLVDYIRTMSDLESRMSIENTDKKEWNKFYTKFTKEFQTLFVEKKSIIDDYKIKYNI